jgi:hypothetical protein
LIGRDSKQIHTKLLAASGRDSCIAGSVKHRVLECNGGQMDLTNSSKVSRLHNDIAHA